MNQGVTIILYIHNQLWSLVKLSGVVDDVSKMVTECLRATKVNILHDKNKKAFSKIFIFFIYFWGSVTFHSMCL